MNEKLMKINPENLLFFDIETVRGSKDFDENHKHYDIWAWKQRDRDTNELPPSEEIISEYYNKAALNAEWNKIVVISLGYVKDGKIRLKSLVGEEKDILEQFVGIVKSQNRILCGYNIIGFDLPTIRKRFMANGLEGYLNGRQGNDSGDVKPWTLAEVILDLMNEWKGTGYYNASLEELCMLYGIDSKTEIHGNEVSKVFYEGNIGKLARYCEEDVASCINLFMGLTGREFLEVEQPKEEPFSEKMSPLEKIFNLKELSPEIKKELIELIGKKKVLKKDKKMISNILYGLVLNQSFDKKDSKAIMEQKQKEVDSFVESL